MYRKCRDNCESKYVPINSIDDAIYHSCVLILARYYTNIEKGLDLTFAMSKLPLSMRSHYIKKAKEVLSSHDMNQFQITPMPQLMSFVP